MSMHRIEMKFIISFAEYYSFRERLSFYATPDAHGQKNGRYPVFSSYYDTHDLEFYNDKIEGEFEHLKIRVRGYAKSLELAQHLFLEAKVKNSNRQTKVRLPFSLNREVASSINESGHKDLVYFQEYCGKKELRHACNVFYEREAYALTSGVDKIRINFDTNILYLHRDELTVTGEHIETRQLLAPGQVVLEIKHTSTTLPQFLQQELHHLQTSITSYSKYANAIYRLGKLTDITGAY
jgi:SPX domain protein involved in polyphosphate accumulation